MQRSLQLVVLALLAAGSACTMTKPPTGSEQAAQATATMQSVDVDLREAVAQIEMIDVSLRRLTQTQEHDLRTAFKSYSADVSRMESLSETLSEHNAELTARGQAYFAEWQVQGTTYTNPAIRAASEQRRAELGAIFRNISESGIGMQGSLAAYMRDLRELRTLLAQDLSYRTIESIDPIVQQTLSDGRDLKSVILPILGALDEARTEMTQGTPRS